MSFRLHALALAITASLSSAAPAAPSPDATTLDRVEVHGAHLRPLPVAENAGNTRDRRAHHGADVASLLSQVPGVALQGAGGASSLPVLRGLADDRVRIAIDGMALLASCPNHMNPPLSYLAPSQVRKASVFVGLSPVSLGGDSLGGAIAIEATPLHFNEGNDGWAAGGQLGGYARRQGHARGADLALHAGDADTSLAFIANHADADNYRAAAAFKTFAGTGREGHALPLDEVGSSAYETRNQQLTVAQRIGDQQFDVTIARQDMPFQGYPNQRMDLTDNQADRVNTHWAGTLGGLAVDARLWHEQVDHAMDFGPDKRFWYGMASNVPGGMMEGRPCAPISATCAAGMPMLAESQTNGASFNVERTNAQGDALRAGIDALAYRLDDYWPASGSAMWPGTFININAGQRDRAGAFVEWESTPSEGWTRLVGLRVDRVVTDAGPVRGYDIDPAPPGSYAMTAADAAAFNARDRRQSDLHWGFTAMLRRSFESGVSAEVGVARRVRSPNLHERYAWSTWSMAALMNNTVGDGNGYVGDISLKPETAHTLSATLDWRDDANGHSARLSPYVTWVDDYIDAVRLTSNATGFNVLRYANQSARLHGVDASATWTLADGAAGHWALEGSASVTRGRNRQTGDGLYNVMPPQARLALVHHRGPWEARLGWEGVRRKSARSAVRNEIRTAGYGLLGASVAWASDDLRIDVGVDNLLDRFYQHPLGGAYVGQGATMMLAGVPAGIAVPGPGRSWRAGFRWSF
jgi:iron complex outermembrane receptor protein